MTTLEQMTTQFDNPLVSQLFKDAYKKITLKMISSGLSIDKANRVAFDLLVTDGLFENLLQNTITK